MELIQPVQHGAHLLREIAETKPAAGEIALWWLGQSGYAIKTASAYFFVDLYLSEHLTAKYADTPKPHIRMTESPLRGGDITDAQLVFSSHKHSDHLDPGTMPDLMRASPDAKLVLPAVLVDHAVASVGLPRDRLIPTRGDETLNLDGLTVHSIPSAHPGLDYDEKTGYPFLGYIFEADGITIYHSGDTLIYDGLAERLNRYRPQIAFLPINGTDARRTELAVPPNMSAHDAVDLAKETGIGLVIPHHYDMFTFNTIDVTAFTSYANEQGQAYRVLQCGERFTWKPAT